MSTATRFSRCSLAGMFIPVVCGLLCGLTLASRTASGADRDPTLAGIKAKLRAWRRQFATIRVVWHSWDPGQKVQQENYGRYELVWADWGAVRFQHSMTSKGKPIYRDAFGAEGDRPWAANTKRGEDPQQWTLIQHLRSDPARPLQFTTACGAVYGLWDGSGFWVNELLARHKDVVLTGIETIGGHSCAVVRLAWKSTAGASHQHIYWCDPQRGFLPRKMQHRFRGPSDRTWKDGWTWTADKFERVAGRLWFPKSGHFGLPSYRNEGFTWIVKRVSLNESLPRSFFQAPTPSSRTRIIDYRRMNVSGGARRKGKPSNDSVPGVLSPIRAVLPSSPWKWVGIGAIVVFGIGLFLRWRRRRVRKA